ncbi:MAG: SDR family oxidoreductase [Cyanobacteria bacterium SID2]|nr:SDR family oxidoreductase [Cyanobacteria bacterium SID2]
MPTALITGASSGIGAEFARQLAQRQSDLVLVARSEDALQQLARQLQAQYSIQTTVIACDLTEPEATERVYRETEGRGVSIDLLVNNAGFGDYGAFSLRDRSKLLAMVQLNVTALVDLTHRFLVPMQQRRRGSIINVGSIAGFQPLPYLAVYAATKAFVLSFSESLWAENRNTGVKVLAVCPGPTDTNFAKIAGLSDSDSQSQPKNQNAIDSPETVVKDALSALKKDQPSAVVGSIFNQIITTLPRFLSRSTLVTSIEKQFRPKEKF